MPDRDHEDVTRYGLDQVSEAELLARQIECTFCVVREDESTKAWFHPALAAAVRPGDPEAAAAFVRHLDAPRRVVLEVVPEGRICFDSTQMWQDTPYAAPAGLTTATGE
jgi:hypothetical protein